MKRWQRRVRISEIHAIAQVALTHGRHNIDYKKYHTELTSLNEAHSSKPSTDWIEAMVMLNASQRKRSRRTLGLMRRLSQRHTDQGTEAEFQAFETMVSKALAPDRLNHHGYGQTFAHLDHDDIWSHLREVIEALENEGHSVFLNSGTLLGVVRDGKLIEHDDDIDLAVELSAKTQKEAAAEWIEIRDLLEKMDLFDHEANKNPTIHKLTSKEVNGRFVEIDLFPLWYQDTDEGERAWLYPHTRGELKREDIFPLKACDVSGLMLPAVPEKMLALNYGENWQTPDPLWRFNWRDSHAHFKEFSSSLKPLRQRIRKAKKAKVAAIDNTDLEKEAA